MRGKSVTTIVVIVLVVVVAGLFVRGYRQGRQFPSGSPEAALKEWFGTQTFGQPAKSCNFMTPDSAAKIKSFVASNPDAAADCPSAVAYAVANPGNSPMFGVIHAAANGPWSMPDSGVVTVAPDGKTAEVLPTAFEVPGTDATVMAGRVTMVKGSDNWLVQVVKVRS
jgi:hypothetical protein